MKNTDRTMEVIDENGNKKNMQILFTTQIDGYDNNYVFYFDPAANNGQVFASIYTDDGHLNPVSSDDEWEKLNEVFEDYIENMKHNCHKCKDDNDSHCDCDHGKCNCDEHDNCNCNIDCDCEDK